MSRTAWAVLLTIALAPAALGLGNEVQEVDPAQYADVARRMVQSGDWLHLRDQNGPFWNKPPLTMWLQAAGMAAFGIDAFAVRLPGLLFSVVTMLSAFLIGRSLASERRGLIAAALVGASLSTQLLVLDPKVDAALTAMTSLSIALMLEGRSRPWLRLVAWLVAGLAVLSKGPIGLGIPVLALLPEVLRSTWRSPPVSLGRRLWSVWPFGLLLSAAVATPFYLATLESTGEEGVWYMLWYQGFGRLVGQAGFLDDTTPLFFVHTALWVFLPLTPLLLQTLARRFVDVVRDRSLPGSLARVPVWWFGLTFVVLSLSTYKLPQYLFPLTTPAALLVAEELERLEPLATRRWRSLFVVFSALGLVFGVLVFAFSFPAPSWVVLGWGVVSSAPLLFLVTWGRRLASLEGLVTAMVVSLAGAWALLHGYVQPRLLEFNPGREVGRLVREVDPSSALLPCVFAEPLFSYSFYARRDATYLMPDQLKDVVAQGRAKVAVVGPDGPLSALEEQGLSYEELASFELFTTSRPSRRFLLAASRAETLTRVRLVRVWLTSSSSSPPR